MWNSGFRAVFPGSRAAVDLVDPGRSLQAQKKTLCLTRWSVATSISRSKSEAHITFS